MRKADCAVRIDDEIAAELRAVALNPAPSSTAQHQARVHHPDLGLPRMHKRMFQLIGAIRDAVRIEKQCKARACFGLPDTRLICRAKRNENDAGVRRLKRGNMLAQLRHMLAARQSTQVAQEHKQSILSLAK